LTQPSGLPTRRRARPVRNESLAHAASSSVWVAVDGRRHRLCDLGRGRRVRPSLTYTVLTVYYVIAADLNPLQLVLVGTVLEAAVLLLEVPTGVIADVFSRRLSILLGHLLWGVAFVLEGSAPLFAAILLAEVIRAIGECCLSGATQAWLADEVGEERIGALFVRGAQIGRVGSLLGIVGSVGLASVQLNLPVIVGGALSMLLAGWLLMVMPERGFRPIERSGAGGGLFQTAATGVRQFRERPLLLVFLGIAAAVGASSEGYDRLWEAHFLASFTFPSLGALEPIVWFGIFNGVGLLLGIAAAEALTRLDLTDDRVLARWGLLSHAGWLVSAVALGLAPDFWVAVVALWAARVCKVVGQPLLSTWITRSIPPQVRATVLSALSQGDAFGQMLGGPAIGAIGTWSSLRAAIVATGILHTPTLLLLTRARRLLDAPAVPGTSTASSASS
jgi:DHA3 family tetracycline resistance protein-like MFS transporter